MISKIKRFFHKEKEVKSSQYIQLKGKKKLTKRERKRLYEKNKIVKTSNANLKTDLTSTKTISRVKHSRKTKVKFGRKMFTVLGSSLLLMGCQFSEPTEIINSNNINPIKDHETMNKNTLNEQTIGIVDDEVNSELDGPISIGDMASLQDSARYYQTASMLDNGVPVSNNMYVDRDDYNIISAVAVVDEYNNIIYVNYDEGYELFNVLDEVRDLGITNYQIVLHYGPLTAEQKTDDVNQYQLGWSSINSMNKIKSKKN